MFRRKKKKKNRQKNAKSKHKPAFQENPKNFTQNNSKNSRALDTAEQAGGLIDLMAGFDTPIESKPIIDTALLNLDLKNEKNEPEVVYKDIEVLSADSSPADDGVLGLNFFKQRPIIEVKHTETVKKNMFQSYRLFTIVT